MAGGGGGVTVNPPLNSCPAPPSCRPYPPYFPKNEFQNKFGKCSQPDFFEGIKQFAGECASCHTINLFAQLHPAVDLVSLVWWGCWCPIFRTCPIFRPCPIFRTFVFVSDISTMPKKYFKNSLQKTCKYGRNIGHLYCSNGATVIHLKHSF